MCGIVAVYQIDGQPISLAVLRHMTDSIRHRGPDGEGHYIDRSVALGHRRLAIIDLTPAGHQPMSNETGDVMITFNGEIYNYLQLRVELQAAGHRFQSQSDTEVIVHAYEEWGERCVERFNGMFAFAIYDRRPVEGYSRNADMGRMFLARDRYGVKPLYYYADYRHVLAASEIKALLCHPAVRTRLCYPALSEYFTFQNIFSDLTLFDGIRLLPAGCTLTIDPTDEQPLRQRRYWDYCFADDRRGLSMAECAEELGHLFDQAVVHQLVSDVPVGSYLSGGMDSGSITAVASRHIPRIHTFTCGFDLSSASGLELGFDERAAAEAMANLFKTEHYQVVLHAGDMEHILPDLVWHLEDLRVGQCYPNYYVAGLASKFVKVVLSGAGGDELFAGYPWRYYRGMQASSPQAFYDSYYSYWQRLVPDEDRVSFYRGEAFRELRHHAPLDVFRSVFAQSEPQLSTIEGIVNASLYFEIKTFLHGLFVVEDKISMAHGLETRVPFLDNNLVDFALRVPAAYKLRELAHAPQVDEDEVGKLKRYAAQPTADGKIVLRQAMSRLVPDGILARAKQGFSAPDASWFRGESIDYVNRLLRNQRARIYEILEPTYVTRKLDEHTSGQHNHRLFIWSLLSFEWWLRKFDPAM